MSSRKKLRSMSESRAEAKATIKWKPGSTIADVYRVEPLEIHDGGYGSINLVHHLKWNVDLIVKTPNETTIREAGGIERFKEREAYEWVRLGLHPNIVTCFYVRTLEDDIPRVFIEYVDGGNLADWLKQGKPIDLITALDIAIQICWGTGWAHKQKPALVHRDIKPANILMTAANTPKVTDFGLVKPVGTVEDLTNAKAKRTRDVTTTGGTVGYAAPEQWKLGAPITAATDVYAIGVVLYELLQHPLGLPLFAGALPDALPALRRDALKKRGDSLSNILLRSMAHKPEERYPDAVSLAEDLVQTYSAIAGGAYFRKEPEETEILADGLNNEALSLLDLKKEPEAEASWKRALEIDPHHLEATYNLGVFLWRKGELTDETLVKRLTAVEADITSGWLGSYLLALVHLDRGDLDTAIPLLEKAEQHSSENAEVHATLDLARSGKIGRNHYLNHFSINWPYEPNRLSLNGQWILSGEGEGHRLWLFEVATSRYLHPFGDSTGYPLSLSPDGRFALTCSIGRPTPTLSLWEVRTARCLHSWEVKHKIDSRTCTCLSADGRLALLTSVDDLNTPRLWEITTGRHLHTFKGHSGWVNSVCLSVDGQYALSGSSDHTLKLWDVASGNCLRTFEGHTASVSSVYLSENGRFALSGSSDRTMRLWEIATGRCLREFTGLVHYVSAVCISANGRIALSGETHMSDDGYLRVWEAATGRCLRSFNTMGINSIALTSDGHSALAAKSGGADLLEVVTEESQVCQLRLSRPRPYTELLKFETQAADLLNSAETALQQTRFVEALDLVRKARGIPGYERNPRVVEIWKRVSSVSSRTGLRSAEVLRIFQEHTSYVECACLSTDGRFALSGGDDKSLHLWEVSTGRRLRTFEGHTDKVLSACLSRNSGSALSGSMDNTLKLWDIASGKCLRTFKGHADLVTSVCLSPDGRFALSGSYDRTLRLWEVATGRCLRIFEGHTMQVSCVCLSADGRLALSGSGYKRFYKSGESLSDPPGDSTLRLWDIASGRCLQVWGGVKLVPDENLPQYHIMKPLEHQGVDSVCLSTDGHFALSGSLHDKTLRLWDVASGRCLRVFTGHTDGVTSVCLSADGRFALSGAQDATIRLWEAATGQCLRIFQEHRRAQTVRSISMSANGQYVLSAGSISDGTDFDYSLRLWELDWELEAHAPADWDEGARPYLETFRLLHMPDAAALPQDHTSSGQELALSLTRQGKPTWTEDDFQQFLYTLSCAGYGWLRSDGVRARASENQQILTGGLQNPKRPSLQRRWPAKISSVLGNVLGVLLLSLLSLIVVAMDLFSLPVFIRWQYHSWPLALIGFLTSLIVFLTYLACIRGISRRVVISLRTSGGYSQGQSTRMVRRPVNLVAASVITVSYAIGWGLIGWIFTTHNSLSRLSLALMGVSSFIGLCIHSFPIWDKIRVDKESNRIFKRDQH